MEAEDPLSDLADIHLPDAVSFWPPAPGWWVLVALALVGLFYLYRHQLARIFLRRRLRAALRELDAALQRFGTQHADSATRNAAGLQLLQDCNAILKRVALVNSRDPQVPKLTGHAWLRFLDERLGSADFSSGAGRVLADGVYRPVFDADTSALHALCRRWIEQSYLLSMRAPRPPRATGGA